MPAFIPDSSAMPAEYASLLQTVAEAMPEYFSGAGDGKLSFTQSAPDHFAVSFSGTETVISAGSRPAFLRALGCAMAGRETAGKLRFTTLGVMLDCSRNRVYTVDFIKSILLKTALTGFNLLMLYTEDVYELPGEPAFGYMRGRYTAEEIREIDRYAKRLGIEVTACIQTLGHLEHIFTHYQYSGIRDTAGILLAEEDATYSLIEKMIRFQAENLSSRQIHIGMDETHGLGRGRFLDIHGYEPQKEIYLRHLTKVCAICRKYGLTPAIWSDMLLRFEDPGTIRAALPPDLKLYCWNYSATDEKTYEDILGRHGQFQRETAMASAVYTYNTFCWFAEKTEAALPPCIRACENKGVRELLITVWGDAGAFCNFDSALAGLVYASNAACGEEDAGLASALFHTICGEEYPLFRKASALHRIIRKNIIPVPGLLWQDPLQGGIYSYCFSKYGDIMRIYLRDLKEVHRDLSGRTLSPSLRQIFSVIDLLLHGIFFREKLLKAYAERRQELLLEIRGRDIPAYLEKITAFDHWFRREWMRSAKPFGLEIIQRRNAGLAARVEETALRLDEFFSGKRSRIEELDEALRASAVPDFHPAPPVFSSCLEIY